MEKLGIVLIYLVLLLDIKLNFETKNNNIKIEYYGLLWVLLSIIIDKRVKWFYLDVSSKN